MLQPGIFSAGSGMANFFQKNKREFWRKLIAVFFEYSTNDICRESRRLIRKFKSESNWEGEQTGEMSVENKHVVSNHIASRLEIKYTFADNCR